MKSQFFAECYRTSIIGEGGAVVERIDGYFPHPSPMLIDICKQWRSEIFVELDYHPMSRGQVARKREIRKSSFET